MVVVAITPREAEQDALPVQEKKGARSILAYNERKNIRQQWRQFLHNAQQQRFFLATGAAGKIPLLYLNFYLTSSDLGRLSISCWGAFISRSPAFREASSQPLSAGLTDSAALLNS